MTAPITRTVRQLLDDQQKRNLSRELSEAVRAADLADRRTGTGRKLAVRLARHVVALANVARHLDLAKQAAADGDWHAKVIVVEYDARLKEQERLLQKLLSDESFNDPRLTKLGLQKWSKLILKEESARKAAPGQRPSKATRGTCRKCGKGGQVLNHLGRCGVCSAAANERRPTPPKGRTKRAAVGTERRQQELMKQLFGR